MIEAMNTPTTYWSQPVDRVLDALDSSPAGLSSQEAQLRLQQIGPNAFERHRRVTGVRLLLNQFRSPLILILVFAAIVSAFAHEWVDASVVLVIVIASALLSFYQEYTATNAVEKLRTRVTARATVLRDGNPQPIPAEGVVPGDVVLLSAGSLIPADAVLLDAKECFVNQAVLTGESFPVEKQPGATTAGAGLAERTGCVFQGTSVRSGSTLR